MKKTKLFILVFLIVFGIVFLANSAYSQSAVGIGLQISDTSGPIINLTMPINRSGTPHGNITFLYNVSDLSNVNNCSLIINGKINRTENSISKNTPIYFIVNNTDIGVYNWSINCTDSLGFNSSSEERVFSVFLMTNFNGSTNNLSKISVANVTHFILETTGFGKINFSEGLDLLSQGFDFNRYINISFNKIELNSTVLLALNKSATLQLVGLTFSNPRIARDGFVCPETICKKLSYSSGVLTFNVSHFTSYSAEETPAEAETPSPSGGGAAGGGGGGGGGGGPPTISIVTDFSIDKTNLKVLLRQGETRKETLSIKNIGTTIFDVKAILNEIEKFKISPEGNELITTLQPNEEKTIELIFKALENEKPDIYPSKITFKSPSAEKEIATIVEVDSAQPLFDADVAVLAGSKKIFPGEEIILEVNLFNVRGFGRVDVSIEYAIKDLQGTLIASEHETLAVETQAKFTRSLSVPSDLKPGTYIAAAKITYADSVGIGSDLFEVHAKTIRLYPIQITDYRVIALFGAVTLIAGVLIFSAYRAGYFKKKALKTKVEEIKELKEEGKAQKLKKELDALEGAYKSGFISEESYKRDKQRIEDRLSRLK